jgi:D-lactate dehydrogenase (cytochrome)
MTPPGTTIRRMESHAPAAPELLADLAAAVGAEQVSTGDDDRLRHGTDESWHDPAPPDAVVYPRSTEEVVAVVRACAAHRTPLIPFGAGSSLEGHVAALHGGVSIDMTHMNRILRVSVEDMDATVEAGVTRLQLEAKLRPEGVFYPVDPGADATIGGMIATGASGTTTVRYGGTRENVLALRAVTADGRVITTGTRARKSSAGYDLTHLLIGSEGTLGVVTEATLRLRPTPEAMSAAVCAFPTLDAAVDCVIAVSQYGIAVARIELLDEASMDAVERRFELGYPIAPTLFLEFHGSEAEVREQAAAVGELAEEHGSAGFTWTTDESERRRLWDARHRAYEAGLAVRAGARIFTADACVPISRLAETIKSTRRDIDEAGIVAPILGHVGDGNFHVMFVIHPDDAEGIEVVKRLNDRLVERAIAAEGTCTGEHGIGYGKSGYLVAERGRDAVEAMRAVKSALDPEGLFNPGKVLPPA